jgi:hypothetical protein
MYNAISDRPSPLQARTRLRTYVFLYAAADPRIPSYVHQLDVCALGYA